MYSKHSAHDFPPSEIVRNFQGHTYTKKFIQVWMMMIVKMSLGFDDDDDILRMESIRWFDDMMMLG